MPGNLLSINLHRSRPFVRTESYGSMVRGAEMTAVDVVLLNGASLPPGFREQCDQLIDDLDNQTPGYWAFEDGRNKPFMDIVKSWRNREVLRKLKNHEKGEWSKTARGLIPLIVTAVDLSGGSPNSEKELEALGLRNTTERQRSVFCEDKKVMFVPTLPGKPFAVKWADKETSYVVRAFLLLIHLVLCRYPKSVPKASLIAFYTL